jgi:nitrate/TMAO reductase-like tetraheme cytochrome c subunit
MKLNKTLQKLVSILTLSLLSFAFTSPIFAEKEVHKDITNLKSSKCKKCHEDIYDQWKSSMHAKSTALEDPIHGTFYKAVVGDPTKEGVRSGKNKDKYPACLQCHSPAAAKAKKTDLTAKKSYGEGVNCISCHTLTKFKGTQKTGGGLQLGMKAYEYSTTHIQGSMGTADKTKKHRKKFGFDVVGNPGLMKTSDACMGCHDQRPNSNKVSLCQTGAEITSAKGSTTCQTCHMPTANGIINHEMSGGHSAEMVSRGLVLTVDATKSADTVTAVVKVRNLLPHSFPTGAPFRNFYIKTVAFNKEGEEIWSNTKSHPMKDDKQAMFMYTIGNDDGPSSPPLATKVWGDSRLKPNETRLISYEITAPGVATIKSTAYYDLLLVPIKKKFADKLPKDLMKPKLIAQALISL